MHILSKYPPEPVTTIPNALMLFGVAALAYAALDDITTDLTAAGFAMERLSLLGCALWLGLLATRLLRSRQPLTGWISLGALAGAAWGQAALAPGNAGSHPLEVALVSGALLWFLALAAALGWRAWRRA